MDHALPMEGNYNVTFELILFEGNNSIKFQYKDVVFGHPIWTDIDYGGTATVGIENETGFGGLQYSFDSQNLSDNLAIQFISYPVDYIMINDTVAGGGNVVGDVTYSGGQTDQFFAHSFNNIKGYIGDVSVEWISSNTSVGTVTTPGPSTTFSAVGEGTCNVTAVYNGTISNVTGTITVTIPPDIENVNYSPTYPNGSSIVTVTADITDPNGVNVTTLYYSFDGSSYTPVPMSNVGGDTYAGSIPATGSSTTVYFYINATDDNNNLNTTSIFSYFVDADFPGLGIPKRTPEYPNSTNTVDITIDITEDSQVGSADIFYSYDGSSWNSVSMSDLGSGNFYAHYVDSGLEGWTHYPLSGPAGDNWEITSAGGSISPLNSWHSGLEPGPYWGDSCLESPVLTDLPPETNLTFWHWYDLDLTNDGGIVEINNGSGWTQLFPVAGYDTAISSGTQNPLQGLDAFTTFQFWVQETFVLSDHAGKDIRLRFRVGWNNVENGPNNGWYIDNIILHSEMRGWNAQIPGPGFPTTVEYYINVTDMAGNYNQTSSYFYPAGSDLVLTLDDIEIIPNPVETGSSVTIEADISNTGGFVGDVEVRFYLGDPDVDDDNIIDGAAVEIGSPDTVSLGINGNALASTTWSPPGVGFYEIFVWVDPLNSTWEFDEWNNLQGKTLPMFKWVDTFDDNKKTESKDNITFYKGDAAIGEGYNFSFTSSNEGFSVEINQPNSDIYWDSIDENVYFEANGSDPNDEQYTHSLFGPVNQDSGSWSLSARTMITARGVWQNAVPLYIANFTNSEILYTADTISFDYASKSQAIRGLYTDSTGTVRIDISTYISINTEYRMKAEYDEITKELGLQILDENEVVLVEDSYIIGTNSNDGFIFGKLGVGTNGSSVPPLPYCTGWTDDINFTFIGFSYDNGSLLSTPITISLDWEWIALYVNKTEPAGTYINVSIIDATSGNPIPGFEDLTGEYIDISGIDTSIYTSIKLLAEFTGYGTTGAKLHYWALDYDGLSISFNVYKGWNMISIPMNKTTTDLEIIFASLNYESVEWWDVTDTNDHWKVYNFGKGAQNDLTDIDKTMGLWLYVLNSDMLTVTGLQPNPTGIQLKAGWNFVGYPSLTSKSVGINAGEAFESISSYVTMAQYFDANDGTNLWKEWGAGTPGDLTVLNPGNGIWIHVTGDCTWTVDW
jgi:hypothetical protein